MRYLQPHIERDLGKKMVFVAGPRQCGKTTLARHVLANAGERGLYLNWDDSDHRQQILSRAWRDSDVLIAFDELHKYGRWKSWLKGIYDTRPAKQSFLVTGSARLDVYRRGGDSMLGRYHHWRLHPFCLAERPDSMRGPRALERLLTVGGFPEPFFDGDERNARRWRRERRDRVFREDIRDLERVRDLSALELLIRLLATRVGSQVVVANLARDLEVAHATVKNWLDVFERMFLVFHVLPYHRGITRALAKAPKIYFYDNIDVEGDIGSRFENLVASHLLKRIQFLEDLSGHRYELRYLRDREKREVDFVVLKDGAVNALIEVKWRDTAPSAALSHYARLLKPRQTIQIVGELKRGYDKNGIRVRSALETFSSLDQDL